MIRNLLSSTLMSTFASGLNAIAAMFLRFSKGNVCDLLLGIVNIELRDARIGYVLHKIKNSHSVSNRTVHGISVWCEYNITFPVYGSTQVGKLL